jgi:DNA-binding LytR/AlgR family response regulator
MFKIPGFYKLIPPESLVWIEGEGNYSVVHFDNQQTYLASVTLKWFERQLSSFIRVHRKALVNPGCIRSLTFEGANQGAVILKDGRTLPISRNRMNDVKQRLGVPLVGGNRIRAWDMAATNESLAVSLNLTKS